MFIRISPPSRLSDRIKVDYVPLDEVKISGLKWESKLRKGSVNAEEMLSSLIEDHSDPGTEKEREKLMQKLNDETGSGLVELLNVLQPYVDHEIHTDSDFEIVDEVNE